MRILNSFLGNRRGNIAIYGAIAAVPIAIATGLAVDYDSAVRARSDLQLALDGAVMAIAREGESLSQDAAEKIAAQFIAANYKGKVLDVTVSRQGTATQVRGAIDLPMVFGGVIGKKSQRIETAAGADVAGASYEIGLVLDTTGSMAGGKIEAMKDAVIGLVDTMSSQVTAKEKLKFAVVPFSTFVNVGPDKGPQYDEDGKTTKLAELWIDQFALNPIPQQDLVKYVNRFATYKRLGVQWPGCVETRPPTASGAHDVDDTVPKLTKPETLFVPAFSIDEPDDPWLYPNSYVADGAAAAGTGTPEERFQRYGAPAVPEMPANFIAWIKYILSWKDVPIDSSVQTFYSDSTQEKGPDFRCDSQPVMALNSDAKAVKDKVSSLQPAGSTNIVEGVMWGWRMLSSRAPFTEGRKEGLGGNKKIMVVLTDGSNWLGNLPNDFGSAYGSFGYLADGRIGDIMADSAGTTAAMNEKTLAGCTNAKKDGIEIYTILLEVDSKATSELLEKCATDPAHYFNVPDRQKLDDAFKGIKDSLSVVRLSS